MRRPPSERHPVLVALGTRPEAIKLAPVILALRERAIPTHVLSTGQHREMLEQTLAAFELEPDSELAVMRPNQSLAGLSAELLTSADQSLQSIDPAWTVVQGDTTTVAMVALASFYRKVPIAHVEAGLRTHDKYDPFPEEINRTLAGALAELHFAPTEPARDNLLAEGVARSRIHVVGNTVIDSLRRVSAKAAQLSAEDAGFDAAPDKKLVLVTGHRRESFGKGLREVFAGLRSLADEFAESIELVYPVHLNPNVQGPARELLGDVENVRLIEPLGYLAFVKAMMSAHLIITDSGGVQEEAAALGVPTLVTRRTTERREAIEAGVAELVETDSSKLVAAARRLLRDADSHAARAKPSDAFGDGRAAQRAVDILAAEFVGAAGANEPRDRAGA